MLVMTTLFIGTSDSLPETSYTKMIDVWMLFGLITTFVEVVIHTWIEFLRDDEGREINDHGRTLEVGPKTTTVSSKWEGPCAKML